MEFYAPLVKAESKFNCKGRNPIFTLAKKDKDQEYWPRLTKEKVRNTRITVDWDRWLDEDEEGESAAKQTGDLDPSAMKSFDD